MSVNPKELVSGIQVFNGDTLLKQQELGRHEAWRQKQWQAQQQAHADALARQQAQKYAENIGKVGKALEVDYSRVIDQKNREEILKDYNNFQKEALTIYSSDPQFRQSGVLSIENQMKVNDMQNKIKNRIFLGEEEPKAYSTLATKVLGADFDTEKALAELNEFRTNKAPNMSVEDRYKWINSYTPPQKQVTWDVEKIVGRGEGKPIQIADNPVDGKKAEYSKANQIQYIQNYLKTPAGIDNYHTYVKAWANKGVQKGLEDYINDTEAYAASRQKEGYYGNGGNTYVSLNDGGKDPFIIPKENDAWQFNDKGITQKAGENIGTIGEVREVDGKKYMVLSQIKDMNNAPVTGDKELDAIMATIQGAVRSKDPKKRDEILIPMNNSYNKMLLRNKLKLEGFEYKDEPSAKPATAQPKPKNFVKDLDPSKEIAPASLVVDGVYNVNGEYRKWNGSKLVKIQ